MTERKKWFLTAMAIVVIAVAYFVPSVVSEMINHSGHTVKISNPG